MRTISFAIIVSACALCTTIKLQAQTPFNGYELGLPATIECEQFDVGGEGVAYHDTTTKNIGGKYRSEGVDLFRCQDYGGARGYGVGNVAVGEWLKYSITNSEAGTYIYVNVTLQASATDAIQDDVKS
jgi:hypothetical protein